MEFSLNKVDLAFPNNEHLLPISSFSTEQGLTVPSSSSQVRDSNNGGRGRFGADDLQSFVHRNWRRKAACV